MPKVSINILGWNHSLEDISKCLEAVLAQSFSDFEVIYSENGSKESIIPELRSKYGNDAKFRIVDNGSNLGYAGGHNKFFAESQSELVMVMNPDALLEKDFLMHATVPFSDPKVAMVTGKMLKPQPNEEGQWILDGTGIVVSKSRRGRERGQMEVDMGQYDNSFDVFGVSGTAAIYRKSALDKVRLNGEYFDHDFFAYWEDFDLSWRLRLAGFVARYAPKAIVYHARVAGTSKGGYKHIFRFISHHAKLSLNVRKWNWRNHLFCIIKNDFGAAFWKGFPYIFIRELLMLVYITIFETRTLGIVPSFFRLLPTMLEKRAIIQKQRVVTSSEAENWFN